MEFPDGKYCNILKCHEEWNSGEEHKNECVAGAGSDWYWNQ